jgi:hypothetical protein
VVVWLVIVVSTVIATAENYYNIQSLSDNINTINSGTGNIAINLMFDNDIVTANPSNTFLNFDGTNLTGVDIAGKSILTRISQSGTNGRLLTITAPPNNINFSNLSLSTFTFLDDNVTSGTSHNGGTININGDGNKTTRIATFNNMIFDNNKINVTINHSSQFTASGGSLYIDGGFTTNTTAITNKGKNITLKETDFTNNSIHLLNYGYSIARQNIKVTGGAAAILLYDIAKLEHGNVVGNSVTANIKGYVAGGGLYLSGIRTGSSISNFNFTNNSATLLVGSEGTAYAGALFAEQEYSGTAGNNLLIPKTTLNVTETSFINNRAINDGNGAALGGAVVLLHDLDGVFDKVIFENNSVNAKSNYAGGGAIAIHSLYQDSIPLTDADRTNIKNQITKFSETTFTNNKATSTLHSGEGGAIFSTQCIETTKTDFIDNIAEGMSASGGAIIVTKTHDGTFYDSAGTSKIQGGKFTGNQSIANGSISRGGAISTSKNLEIVSSLAFGDVLFRDNIAVSNVTNSAYGNSIFASAAVIFNTELGSKIEDFDGHFITGNVTKIGGGILTLQGETQHQAGSYFIREGVLRSGFTRDGESGFRAVANLNGSQSVGTVVFDKGAIWELDLSNADMSKLVSGVRIADGEITGAEDALRRGNALIDVDLVGGTIKLVRVLEAAKLSDIYASTAYLHKWNTIQKATNSRINQLLYRYGTVQGSYLSGDNSQAEHRGQSYRVPVAAAGVMGTERNFYSAWVNYVGRKSTAGSSFDAYNGQMFETISNGVQFGFDLAYGFGSHFGFMFGYEDLRGDIVNDYIRGDDYYVGVYGAMLFSYGFDIRGMIGFGHQRYLVSRYDLDWGREFIVEPDGNTFEMNLEFGRRFQTWHNSSIRPFFALDYLTNSVSAVDEGAGGFRYDNLSLDQLFLRLGADVQWHFGLLCFDAGVAFSQQVIDDYAEATVSQGPISTALQTCRYGNSVFTFNVGAIYSFNGIRSCNIYINYVGEVFVGGESKSINSLQTGIQWKF